MARRSGRGALRGMHPLVALKRLGLSEAQVAPQARPVEDFHTDDFPTIALLDDGSALILLGRNDDGLYLAETLHGLLAIKPMVLERQYSGHRLHVAARMDAGLRIEVPPAAEPAAARPESDIYAAMAYRCRHSALLRQLLLSAIVGNVLGVAPALFAMAIIDRIPLHDGVLQLLPLAIGIGIALVFELAVKVIGGRIGEGLAAEVVQKTQGTFFQHLTRLELNAVPAGAAGVATSMRAMEHLGRLLPDLFCTLYTDLPFALLIVVYVGWLGGLALSMAPLVAMAAIGVIGAVTMATNRRINSVALSYLTKRASMVEETVSQREQIRVTGATRSLAKVFDEVNDEAGFAAFRQRFMPAVAEMFANRIGQAVWIGVLAIAAFEAAGGTPVSLGATVAAAVLSWRAVRPVAHLVAMSIRMQQLRDSLRQADRLAELPEEKAGDETFTSAHIGGEIAFRNVSYTHPGEKTPALDGVTFTIRAGEHVGIIGSVGSGKTTLGRMILRLFAPGSGVVTLDGRDIAQFDPDELRREIAYMPQDCELFDLSLQNNVTIGLPEINERAYIDALEISGVARIAARRAAGYGFKAGPQGRRLSTGERQAVMIARTLARDASIFVLDEPTSAMDGQYERDLIQKLKSKLQDKTVIVITHRAPVLALVDRVIWLDNGRVVADAPAREVMREMGQQAP